jgi:hypothetical protein
MILWSIYFLAYFLSLYHWATVPAMYVYSLVSSKNPGKPFNLVSKLSYNWNSTKNIVRTAMHWYQTKIILLKSTCITWNFMFSKLAMTLIAGFFKLECSLLRIWLCKMELNHWMPAPWCWLTPMLCSYNNQHHSVR